VESAINEVCDGVMVHERNVPPPPPPHKPPTNMQRERERRKTITSRKRRKTEREEKLRPRSSTVPQYMRGEGGYGGEEEEGGGGGRDRERERERRGRTLEGTEERFDVSRPSKSSERCRSRQRHQRLQLLGRWATMRGRVLLGTWHRCYRATCIGRCSVSPHPRTWSTANRQLVS
jgi:hypothetical protein